MDWKELKHEINMKMVEHVSKCGKKADILKLGKSQYGIFKNRLADLDMDEGTLWGMRVYEDKREDGIVLGRLNPDFFGYKNDPFSPYKMKVDVIIPKEVEKDFNEYIEHVRKWNDRNFGIKLSAVCKGPSGDKNIRFQMHVCGTDKKIVEAWQAISYEISRVLKEKALKGE